MCARPSPFDAPAFSECRYFLRPRTAESPRLILLAGSPLPFYSSCLPLILRCGCSGFPCGTIYRKATAIANTILSLSICNSHCYASHQSLVSTSNATVRSFIINIMQSSFSLFFVFGSCSCCWFDLQRYLCHYTIFSFLLPDLISFKKYLCSWNFAVHGVFYESPSVQWFRRRTKFFFPINAFHGILSLHETY